MACTSGTGSACWVQGVNIGSFSPFVIGTGFTPTAISLQALAVQSTSPMAWLLLPLSLLLVTAWVWHRGRVIRQKSK